MVVARFSDNFWGDKINGFDILCQNLKHSLNNVKELEAYFRECENMEDTYSKLLTKLASQVNRHSTNGTFYPIWSPMKELNERLASTHAQIMHQIRDIIKETQRYYDDLSKKIKKIRDNESQTQICVQNFQEITQLLNKTKENYHSLALDLEKQKRAENTNVQKLEKKVKQAYDEYKQNVDRYNTVRNEYERKFSDSCTHLQLAEELHLKQIKQLVDNYSKIFLNNNQSVKQMYDEFQAKLESLNNDILIQIFIDNKRTGSERPELMTIIEPDFSKLPAATATTVVSTSSGASVSLTSQTSSSAIQQSTSTTSASIPFNANISSNSSNSGGGGNISLSNNVNQYNAFADNDLNLFLNPNIPIPSNISSNDSAKTSSSPFTSVSTTQQNGGTVVNPVNSSSSSSTSSNDMKRSDSRGLNIFNIDILSRNKSKDKKAAQKNTTAAASKNKKKQEPVPPVATSTTQPTITQDLIQINAKDTHSVNSDELTNIVNENNNALSTQRSTNNIRASSSLDLFDQLKFGSNGSDVDSEGYSIRPEYKDKKKAKDNDDMNNFYDSSTTNSDSDSEPESGGTTKVMLKINPKNETTEAAKSNENSELLREVSKNLQLKPLNLVQQQQQQVGGMGSLTQQKKRTYYSFGTLANAANNQQTEQSWPTSGGTNNNSTQAMTRSISFGAAAATTPSPASEHQHGFNTNDFSKVTNIQLTTTPLSTDASLYNIEEDKEVESSFQHTNRRISQLVNNNALNFSLPPTPSIPGRFTPACFPGRTTPNFTHSTTFDNNTTRGATNSPLTVNGNDVIPIAVAFNETIHAYFKLSDPNRYKLKCTGCMRISFPYTAVKFLSSELPQLEFRLSNLQITSQDLIINNQLLSQQQQSTLSLNEHQFQFNTANLTKELREQYQQNKQAAFYNFELLKYDLKSLHDPPLFLNATWKLKILNSSNIELEFSLDYSNQLTNAKPLQNLNFMLALVQQQNVYKIAHLESKPQSLMQDNEDKLQVLWNIPTMSTLSETLSAKFNVCVLNRDEFKSKNLLDSICTQPLLVKFHMDNDTISHAKFDIHSMSYKLSLLREKVESGKYFCTPSLLLLNQTLDGIYEQLTSSLSVDLTDCNNSGSTIVTATSGDAKTPTAGSVSTSIGSSVDILLNY